MATENARLKRLAAERDLDIVGAQGDQRQEVENPQAGREQVALACHRDLSERRARGLIGLPRSCLRYELPAKDTT